MFLAREKELVWEAQRQDSAQPVARAVLVHHARGQRKGAEACGSGVNLGDPSKDTLDGL